MSYKFILIGHTVVDHFEMDEEQFTKPGGIFFAALGFLFVKDIEDEVFLVSQLNDDYSGLFIEVYKNLDLTHLSTNGILPHVYLKLYKDRERDERYENITEKLNLNMDFDEGNFDGVLLNMVTGFDVTHDDLREIRKKFSGLIYLDIHTLSRGLGKNNEREFRQIPSPDKWLSSVDIVQVNENELRTIYNADDELKCAEYILNFRPEILIVTKGKKGLRVYFSSRGSINFFSIPGLKTGREKCIGCGDFFGAVFFYNYIKTADVFESAEKANEAAGLFSSLIDKIDILKSKKDNGN